MAQEPGTNQKDVTISVNTVDHTVPHAKISYATVVDYVYPGGSASAATYIVKYSRGTSENTSGTLPPGGEVMVKDGMRFRVSPTGES